MPIYSTSSSLLERDPITPIILIGRLEIGDLRSLLHFPTFIFDRPKLETLAVHVCKPYPERQCVSLETAFPRINVYVLICEVPEQK